MANNERTELAVKYLPRIIAAVQAWFKRRREARAAK
jgi:hypothetical protein